MWGAIKSDLFEFISTVQEDAQDTISKVVDIQAPRTAADDEKITEDERILSEFRNNLATYSEDVAAEQLPEFEKFMKGFSLSSKADEIEYILELESGVTKHYASLVPSQITPDVFWARYFFKVNILILSSLDSVLESAYDEEEELSWGEDDEEQQQEEQQHHNEEYDRHARNEEGSQVCSTALQETSDQANGSPPSLSVDSKKKEADETEEVALLAASSSNITQLQEANANLSTRAIMLEGEVEKLQNQLIKERTVSAKLRNNVAQGEEREKELAQQVNDLKLKLAAAAVAVADAEAAVREKESSAYAKIDSAPVSSGSSIVDLGADQSHSPPTSLPSGSTKSGAGAGAKCDDLLGPSMSALSLASLQSVSSVSVSASGDSSPSSSSLEGKGKGPIMTTEVTPAETSSAAKKNSQVAFGGGGEEDDEEEEWDNEAWE